MLQLKTCRTVARRRIASRANWKITTVCANRFFLAESIIAQRQNNIMVWQISLIEVVVVGLSLSSIQHSPRVDPVVTLSPSCSSTSSFCL